MGHALKPETLSHKIPKAWNPKPVQSEFVAFALLVVSVSCVCVCVCVHVCLCVLGVVEVLCLCMLYYCLCGWGLEHPIEAGYGGVL
jgi:hypothetical protein